MYFIQNDVVHLGDVAIGGSRMWDFPCVSWSWSKGGSVQAGVQVGEWLAEATDPERSAKVMSPEQLAKVRARELMRLRMSLEKLPDAAQVRIALVHFPPIGADGTPTELSQIMDEFAIDLCIFGHLLP